MRLVLPALLAVLLAAGCVGEAGQDFLGNQGNFLPPNTVQTGTPAIITVGGQQTRPTPPISSNSPFSVSWQVTNAETKQDVTDFTIQVYDWGDCKLDKINDYDIGLLTREGSMTYPGITEAKTGSPTKLDDFDTVVAAFRAGSVRQVKLDLTAPRTNLSTSCDIKFKVSYSFSAISELDVQTISPAYLRQVGSATFQSTERIGSGPVQIRLAPLAALPVRSGDRLPTKLWVENSGGGAFGDIPAGKIRITVPLDWIHSDKPCDKFGKASVQNGKAVFVNERAISMVSESGTKSEPIVCYWTMPTVELTKDSTMQAGMDYTYDVHDSISVEIAPVIVG